MKDKKKVKRVGVDCIFRAIGRSRQFTTPGNFEAFNMLMNKLDKLSIVHQPGKLIFEFVPGELPAGSSSFLKRQDIDGQMCICGHNILTHAGKYFRKVACQVAGCGCRKYKPKIKERRTSYESNS